MPLWGQYCPLPAVAALACLPPVGDGPILSRLGLLSPLFYEQGWRCLESESEGAQSCPTLSNPMDCSLPGSSVHGILQKEYWSGLPFPSPGDHPDPGIEPPDYGIDTTQKALT